MSASGSFVGGSYSLSSYMLAGSAQVATSDSSSQQAGVESFGLMMGGTSFANSDASVGFEQPVPSGHASGRHLRQ